VRFFSGVVFIAFIFKKNNHHHHQTAPLGGVGALVREQAAAAVDALAGRRREVETPLLFG
jgi:hypothetical protein